MSAPPAALCSAADVAAALGQHRPTPEQAAVVEAPLAPLLVVAGAGSGKTETMAARVVWLVANGLVAPDRVLGLTFTRRAAGELAERVRARLTALHRAGLGPPPGGADGGDGAGGGGAGEPTVATYHAYAASVLADHGLRVGLEPGARLLGEAAAHQLATEVVAGWDDLGGVTRSPASVVDAVLSLAAQCAEHLVDPRDLDAHLRDLAERVRDLPGKPVAAVRRALAALEERRLLVPLVERYAERKRELEVLDHGDQVALAARAAVRAPEAGAHERARFGVVLLDEHQDTSHAQLVLLRALFGGGHPVTAVGDPHQAVYGWRGASAGGLEAFPAHFPAPDGSPARVLALSTSWRNDVAVLDAANRLAAPLRAGSSLDVPLLAARPGAGPGRVAVRVAETAAEEAELVADAVARVWSEDAAAGREHRSTAVLCRRRSQFDLLEEALRARGLPVEVVGLGGLLSRPEVVDVVAALRAAHDPGRGDALLRLLTGARWRLGPRDLAALAAWARERRATGATSGGAGVAGVAGVAGGVADAVAGGVAELAEAASLVEALDALPDPGWTGPGGHGLSDAARPRLLEVAGVLRRLRAASGLPLPDLVAEAERALLLDVELAARPGVPAAAARAHLEAFCDVAASFAQAVDRPSLGAFLAWLAAAETRERGLALAEDGEADRSAEAGATPSRTAVQLLTVHAAKGLEWDVVAVPGLVEKGFPACGTTSSSWLGDPGSLPHALRGDAASLPVLGWEDAADQGEAGRRHAAFLAACGEHELAEERRLAYVAATRARSRLLLTGAWWGAGSTRREPSRFLREALGAAPGTTEGEPRGELPDAPAEADNPALRTRRTASWPADPVADRRPVLEAAATAVRAAAAALDGAAPGGAAPGGAGPVASAPASPWSLEVDQLLAERAAVRAGGPAAVPLPAHLSASRLVQLAHDPEAFALAVRRPLPVEPRAATRRGTRFHAWLEQRFRAEALVDLPDVPGADEDEPADDADLPRLQEAFLASEWAERTPVAVEVALETPLAGLVVRCRVDVVDWKTGPPPTGQRARAAAVQLAVYRLAWSRLSGLPLERVGAAFFSASTGRTVRPVDLLDEAGLEALVAQASAPSHDMTRAFRPVLECR
ncbi:UvrD-helicase domain-containing protein [Quadrisphaera sp. DSM 44207]|uniref:UvrD-helicase domain-containing protein n=1 Tax=Quadrisphaera sp. DSM 44207 TaxID=1881057 RepID=UPI00088ED259|nr:UvrD-helicase domain-containing protein [Quadrisphaera sp. DSM 44207]SDQ72348.1 DNA helicase-2 / ATP-dependent DNA helicase PcrA [Quadrisphaera sp. DSM 44207]